MTAPAPMPTRKPGPPGASVIFMISSIALVFGLFMTLGGAADEPIGWIALLVGVGGHIWAGYNLLVLIEWHIRTPRSPIYQAPQQAFIPQPPAPGGGAFAPPHAGGSAGSAQS